MPFDAWFWSKEQKYGINRLCRACAREKEARRRAARKVVT